VGGAGGGKKRGLAALQRRRTEAAKELSRRRAVEKHALDARMGGEKGGKVVGFRLADGAVQRAAAFAGALVAGLLASAVMMRVGFPRISITVPSIVIMVPGLYLYRAVYYMGTVDVLASMEWIFRAVMIILFLPMGLGLARALTDRAWRHCN
jgi:hypothetical protein